jgi:hypothetical protein
MSNDMARPRNIDKKQKEAGSKLIALRITPSQYLQLRKQAANKGVSVSALIRQRALKAA